MTLRSFTLKPFSLLIAASLFAMQAQALELLPTQGADLKAGTLLAAPQNNNLIAPDAASLARQREAVSVSWPLQSDGKLGNITLNAPFVGESRESYRKVTGAQLNAGIELHTSVPRALVRLQALGEIGQREKAAIAPLSLQIKAQDGRSFANGDGMQAIVDSDKMAKAEMPFASGTSVFRVHPSLGSGKFQLQASRLAEQDEYLINVVEPDSPYVLQLQAEAGNYLHGQNLVLRASLRDVAKNVPLKKLDAQLVSPGGRVFPLKFVADGAKGYRAQIRLDANEEAASLGLWEVQLHADAALSQQNLQRSVRIGVPVALPVAKLDGAARLQAVRGGLGVNLGVETASAGRYEVRGMLYGTLNGKLVPVAVAHAAKWIDAGKGEIALTYDAALFDAMPGLGAPFEVRDLALHDQSRFAVLHKQARGMVLQARDLTQAGVELGAAHAKTNLFADQAQPESGHVFLQKPVKAGLAK